ncbi:MAG: hypothetical protein SCARUB_00445 [Candidatus Scalindua rubra]|uniref:Uncharacterized protein n=1 Tax=Candidatus Scalindua rubra TaxID=1872076 RepID=A0A1E3XHP9_9BACT|nr:MAG: hypothetical protein SCARUB_00445 [Candidatus Scalindua rubra]
MECIDRVDAGSNTVTALQKSAKQSNTKNWECTRVCFTSQNEIQHIVIPDSDKAELSSRRESIFVLKM